MKESEWRAYYRYMVEREVKPAKQIELVANCGGLKKRSIPDSKSTPLNPLPDIEVEETLDEAFERIKGEIRAEGSRETLEKKVDDIKKEIDDIKEASLEERRQIAIIAEELRRQGYTILFH